MNRLTRVRPEKTIDERIRPERPEDRATALTAGWGGSGGLTRWAYAATLEGVNVGPSPLAGEGGREADG